MPQRSCLLGGDSSGNDTILQTCLQASCCLNFCVKESQSILILGQQTHSRQELYPWNSTEAKQAIGHWSSHCVMLKGFEEATGFADNFEGLFLHSFMIWPHGSSTNNTTSGLNLHFSGISKGAKFFREG
jgi:hypothetical protein